MCRCIQILLSINAKIAIHFLHIMHALEAQRNSCMGGIQLAQAQSEQIGTGPVLGGGNGGRLADWPTSVRA